MGENKNTLYVAVELKNGTRCVGVKVNEIGEEYLYLVSPTGSVLTLKTEQVKCAKRLKIDWEKDG